jgi:hypothetical protein
MPRFLVFRMEGTEARARLLEELAPKTCALVWSQLPASGPCGHVMLAGTACALHLDPRLDAPAENQTGLIHPGDVMFMHYPERWRLGFPEAETRITWAYDRFCQPRVPGRMSPEYPNVFAQFEEDSQCFFEACRATFYGGRKPIEVSGSED